jgi:hypothetical protein
MTIVSGIIAKLVLVDWPEEAQFLTSKEKLLLASRLKEDLQEVKMDRLDGQALRNIFSDWKIYCTYAT